MKGIVVQSLSSERKKDEKHPSFVTADRRFSSWICASFHSWVLFNNHKTIQGMPLGMCGGHSSVYSGKAFQAYLAM